MNKNPLISVVIPVYNVENYLKECIESILNQTLQNIEIICVDDGSKDKSLDILKQYASQYKNITIISQHNKGAGIARNIGLRHASGKYILFFDSDDYMSPQTLEILYNKAENDNADIVIGKSRIYNQDSTSFTYPDFVLKTNLINNKTQFSPYEVKEHIFQFTIGWAWDKLYRRDFIVSSKISFQSLRHSNDVYFVFISLVKANKISITINTLFTHRKHTKSLEATRIKQPNCFYKALIKIYKKLKNIKVYDIYEQSFVNFCLTFCYWHITTIEDKKSQKIMKKLYRDILNKIRFYQYPSNFFYDKTSLDYAYKISTHNKYYSKQQNISNSSKIKIFVGYHKPSPIILKKNFIALHLGRKVALHQSKDGVINKDEYKWLIEHTIGDDTGNNISEYNRNFCEMTGIYWMWKNYKSIGNPDYIGFMHYRRFFTLNSIKKYHKFDLTIADSYIYPNVQQQFKNYHKSNDLDYVYNEVITQYPEYKNKIDIYLSGQKSYFFNMFIMKKELFFEYCNFVFPILLKLYKMPKYHQQSERNQRMIAFIAERLSGMFFSIKIQENIKVNISEILRCDTDKKISYAVKKFNNNFVQQKLTKIFEYMHYKYCKILSKLTYGAISKNYKNKYIQCKEIRKLSKKF